MERGGVYWNLEGVDPWDQARDARLYAGPHPVVAHPPCGAWGVFARQGWTHRPLGDDDGCFVSALSSVRAWGGVMEHPACSSAWKAHGLIEPGLSRGWVAAGDGGWTCFVEQGNYGHRARKPTWLYAHGVNPPSLKWGKSTATRNYNNQSTKERRRTPVPFRDLLLSIARGKAEPPRFQLPSIETDENMPRDAFWMRDGRNVVCSKHGHGLGQRCAKCAAPLLWEPQRPPAPIIPAPDRYTGSNLQREAEVARLTEQRNAEHAERHKQAIIAQLKSSVPYTPAGRPIVGYEG